MEAILLFRKLIHPFISKLHVITRGMGLVIFIGVVATVEGDGWLYLCSLVPLIEAGDRDHLGRSRQSSSPGCFIIQTLSPGMRVLRVPGAYSGVYIARANTWDEHQGVLEGIFGQGFPVLPT